MCGIAGFIDISADKNAAVLTRIVQSMSDTLFHRGPDSSGTWIDTKYGVALGHRRLAIIDLSEEGHQPMVSSCGRYVISYNGEIYNFKDLRTQLEAQAHIFKSHSDTETLLTAISAWGLEQALQKSNGMFAFALWDKKERMLHLARDRMGKKPLYYGWAGQNFIFSSELKAFHKHPDFIPRVSRDVLAAYCRHNYVPTPWSIFEDVYKLPAASFLSFSTQEQGQPSLKKYWDIEQVAKDGIQNPLSLSFDSAVDQLDDILTQAVGQRMVSDVPLGAFLSGGIDSSLVAALMQKQSLQPIKTFSIGFEESGFNEAIYAKKVAAHLGTDHTEFYVTADEARDVISFLPEMYDEPFADSSQIPTYHVARLAKKHVTVALSGDGGDESFAGYSRYALGQKVVNNLFWAPHSLRKVMGHLTAIVPELLCSKIATLSRVLNTENKEALYCAMMSYWDHSEDIVLNTQKALKAVEDIDFFKGNKNFINHMMYADMCAYLPDDILTKVDRASMAVSLEARAPLLDYKVIEYAWNLPLDMKIQGGQGKKILRSLLENYVPKPLFDRPKQGFGIPQGEWLRGPLREWAEALLDENHLKNDGFFNPKPVRKLWQQHLEGQNKEYQLWGILMFQAWHEKWMK